MDYQEQYAEQHPSWHQEDALDKADMVLTAMEREGLMPTSICDIGCGTGDVVAQVKRKMGTRLAVGYDISEYAIALAVRHNQDEGLSFRCGDPNDDDQAFDIMLILDVLEHVPDPVEFLRSVKGKAPIAIVNLPLELTVLKVLSSDSLSRGRRSLGHVHYFNAGVAQEMVAEAGWAPQDVWYSPPGLRRVIANPGRRMLRSAQRVATRVNAPIAARTIGGSSLMMVLRASGS